MNESVRILIEAPREDKERYLFMSEEEEAKEWTCNHILREIINLLSNCEKFYHDYSKGLTFEETRLYCSEKLGIELPSQERLEEIRERLDYESLLMSYKEVLLDSSDD